MEHLTKNFNFVNFPKMKYNAVIEHLFNIYFLLVKHFQALWKVGQMNNIYYTICIYNLIGIHALMWLLRLNVHIYVCLAWEVNWPRFSNDWCVQCFMQPIHVHQFQWNVKYKWSRISSLLSLILNVLDKFLVCKNINWIKIAAHCQL